MRLSSLLCYFRHWIKTTCCQMKDPISTQHRSSRRTSTPPPTIPQRSANLTTSPTHPHHRAGPTTTLTIAETRPKSGSPPRCPKRTPPPQCHGDITEPTWTEVFFRAWPSSSDHHRPLSLLSSLFTFVFKGLFGTFHQEIWIGEECPCPIIVRNLCKQLGLCCCKGLTG